MPYGISNALASLITIYLLLHLGVLFYLSHVESKAEKAYNELRKNDPKKSDLGKKLQATALKINITCILFFVPVCVLFSGMFYAKHFN